MRGIHLRAYAKVNFALDVLGVREDGYHEVRTVMQSVSLADDVRIEPIGQGFELRIEPRGTDVGSTEDNTVHGTWTALRELSGEELPVRVHLRKRIPAGAGLGGGSADAAATLHGLNRLFGLGLRDEELAVAGSGTGSDVPFCASGGTMLGEGVGDELSPLPAPPDHYIVIAKPRAGADTAGIYKAFDEHPGNTNPSVDRVVAALKSGDLAALAGALGNDLSRVTKRMVPEVAALEQKLLDAGALGASMSGTGTAVYGIFGSEAEARAAATSLDAAFSGVFGPKGCGMSLVSG